MPRRTVSGSDHPIPRHPIRALRDRVNLITDVLFETRHQVLASREVLAARLDAIACKVDDLATAQSVAGAPVPSPAQGNGGAQEPSAPEWEYAPEGWAKPHDAADGWDVQSVARMYAARWPAFIDRLRGPGPVGALHVVQVGQRMHPREEVISHNIAMVFGYALALSARQADPVSVLDWGGALGHYHALARVLVPDAELDYHVKELAAVCREGRKLSPEVTFHEGETCLERNYDLVLASGAIQYVEDWSGLLARLAPATGRYLLILKVPVTDAPSFVTLQRAYEYGYETEFLGWALNRAEIRTEAQRAGLELVREFFLAMSLDIAHAPGSVHHAGFLFRAN